MAHASLQVCMDNSDWLQGTMSEEISTGLDSSLSSPTGGTTSDCMLAAACNSRAVGGGGGGSVGQPLMERRLRPPHDQNLKCPRCDSTHTKFCYYNNYSLSQPRYFCKTCRRYWTKGGTLRNIPVGGGCRKSNKKSSSKKPNNNDLLLHQHQHHMHPGFSSQGVGAGAGVDSGHHNIHNDHHQLHISIPEVQFSPHLANLIGAQMGLGGGGFMESGGGLLRPIDFMESKYESLVGGSLNRGFDFMGGGHNNNNNNGGHEFGVVEGIIGDHIHLGGNNNSNNNGGYNGLTSTFGGINISSSNTTTSHPLFNLSNSHDDDDHHHHQVHHDGNLGIGFMDQRLLLPYDGNNEENNNNNNNNGQHNGLDVKPNPKLLSLERQDNGCNSNVGIKNNSSYGYNINDTLGSWTTGGMMGGFQSSTTNSLI